MFDRILVLLDGSLAAEQVLPLAKAFAEPFEGTSHGNPTCKAPTLTASLDPVLWKVMTARS